MSRPIKAIIHIKALKHNLDVARKYSPNSEVFTIVKANAYCHGIERVYDAFKTADGFALLDIAEALRIRALGWTSKILLLEGIFCEADLMICAEHHLSFTVHNELQVKWIEAFSNQYPNSTQFDLFLKMNSGMNRLGFPPSSYRDIFQRLKALSCVASITHMTHFSDADGDRLGKSGIEEQVQTFEQTIQGLGGKCSISNSAAILRHSKSLKSDYVRSGVMLYGSSPDYPSHSIHDWELMPTMSLRSEIIAIQQVEEEQSIGYGSTFIAEKTMTIGIVACGYADGYQRTTKTGTPVLVNDQQTHLIGRVSMDMLAVDLSHVNHADIGSEVVLWGQSAQGVILSIDEVAFGSNTVGYELMCGVTARVQFEVHEN